MPEGRMKNQSRKQMKVAYLAPQIPSLSETFVYNEIFELEKQGLTVIPISVRKPGAPALEDPARLLARRTTYLYRLPRSAMMRNAAEMAKARPKPFLKALLHAARDASSIRPPGRVSAGILYRFLAASSVALLLMRKACWHIHAHFAHVPTDIAMYASMISGIPFSFTAHANDIFVRGWLLKEKVERSSFAVAISGFNRDFLVKQGAPLEKLHVVHCGVDTSTFYPRKAKELNQPIRIGSLGRMVEKKGFDLLMDACRVLKIEKMPLVLEIAGDGPLKQELISQAYRKGLGKEAVFVGPLSHEKVGDWLKGLDVFALACRKDREGDMDGIPVVLMEAMLSGVPVVSTALSGVPELIEDGVTGWLAESPKPKDLARAIHAALLDGGVQSGILRKAASKVHTEFNLAKNAMTLAGLFKGECI